MSADFQSIQSILSQLENERETIFRNSERAIIECLRTRKISRSDIDSKLRELHQASKETYLMHVGFGHYHRVSSFSFSIKRLVNEIKEIFQELGSIFSDEDEIEKYITTNSNLQACLKISKMEISMERKHKGWGHYGSFVPTSQREHILSILEPGCECSS